jgi:hypothetical protein
MNQSRRSFNRTIVRTSYVALAGALVGGMSACTAPSQAPTVTAVMTTVTTASPAGTPTPAVAAPASPTVAATAAPVAAVRPLKLSPETGPIKTSFTITADGLPASTAIDFYWGTANGSFDLKAGPENVEFHNKVFQVARVPLGHATTDAQGQVSASFVAPEDYGELHDVYGVIGQKDVAHGGFRIMRQATINPAEGPIGTPITLTVTGLGWQAYQSTIALRYDNMFTGIVTAVTTRGTATAQFRAAGKIGKHVIDLDQGAKSAAFLNNQQSGTADIPDGRFWFNVTDDSALPAPAIDWPNPDRVAALSPAAPRTASSGAPTDPKVKASFDPSEGPILSRPTLSVTGLAPSAKVDAFWVTARGNRVSPSGWSLDTTPFPSATAAADGTLKIPVDIPDDLGGWHVVRLTQGDSVLAEVPYYIDRSLVDVTPQPVKQGETFTVHLKGIGWTELDNGVAVTYDNAYIGFACGFNSNGDVTMPLVATGEPGIHLIDLYPMIYQGHGEPPWGYQVPLLTYKDDAPGLSLGYRLPAIRTAIQIVS